MIEYDFNLDYGSEAAMLEVGVLIENALKEQRVKINVYPGEMYYGDPYWLAIYIWDIFLGTVKCRNYWPSIKDVVNILCKWRPKHEHEGRIWEVEIDYGASEEKWLGEQRMRKLCGQ